MPVKIATETIPHDDAVIVELGARNEINMTVTDTSMTVTQTGTTIPQAGSMTVPQTSMDVSQNGTVSQVGMTTTQTGMTVTQAGATITQTGAIVTQAGMNVGSFLIGSNENDVVMDEPSHVDVHGDPKTGQFLPVEGGYIIVEENGTTGK